MRPPENKPPRLFAREAAFIAGSGANRRLFLFGWAAFGVYGFLVLLLTGVVGESIPRFTAVPLFLFSFWGTLRLAMLWQAGLDRFDPTGGESPGRVFGPAFFFSVAVLGCAWICTREIHSPDTITQWVQAKRFEFREWHPAFHTLLIALTAKVVKSYNMVVLVQSLILAASIAAAAKTLAEIGIRKSLVAAAVVFMTLQPGTLFLSQILWKDTAYAIAVLWICNFGIRILHTEGAWLNSFANACRISAALTCALIFRHNGLFFVFPFLVLLLFFRPGQYRRIILVAGMTLLLFFLIKIPLYRALEVDTGTQNAVPQYYVESAGIPFSMMGDAYYFSREKLPPEVTGFLERIAPREVWQERYEPGNFNSIKFCFPPDRVLKDVPPREFLKLWLKTVRSAPKTSLEGFARATATVWVPYNDGRPEYLTGKTNSWPLSFDIRALELFLYRSPAGILFARIGFWIIVFGAAALAACRRNGFRTLFLLLPLCCYNLCTMLLLYGNSDWRFFYSTPLTAIPLLLAVAADCRNRSGAGDPPARQ